jgi:GAF domain-containing protein
VPPTPVLVRQADLPLPILVRFTAVLAAAPTARAAVLDLVRPVWSRLGYTAGRLWRPDPEACSLVRSAGWQPDATSEVSLPAGANDLPAIARERARLEWGRPRAVPAGQSHPVGSVCVPLQAAGKVVGVLELIGPDASEPTSERLALLGKLGRRLGELLQRTGG